MDREPARSVCTVTAPTEHERVYDLGVNLPRLRVNGWYSTVPWIRITANCVSEEVTLSAGIKVMRREQDDDGA